MGQFFLLSFVHFVSKEIPAQPKITEFLLFSFRIFTTLAPKFACVICLEFLSFPHFAPLSEISCL